MVAKLKSLTLTAGSPLGNSTDNTMDTQLLTRTHICPEWYPVSVSKYHIYTADAVTDLDIFMDNKQ